MVLVLGGYIIYDKFLNEDLNNKDLEQDKDVAQDNNNVNQNNINNLTDYILSSNINSVTLKYCVYDDSLVNQPEQEVYSLTKKDLTRIFTDMEKGTIAKNYYGGLGAPCQPSINISYTSDKNEYELELLDYRYIALESVNDNKVLSYLENSNYIIKKYKDDIDMDTEPYMFEYIYDEDIIDTIYSEYSK